jgi:hypothetical protein
VADVHVNGNASPDPACLGAENVDFSVMTQNFDRTNGYFAGARRSSFRRFPALPLRKLAAITVSSPAKAPSRQIRQCADHHDDWFGVRVFRK